MKECVSCRPDKSNREPGIIKVKKKKFTCEKHFWCLKILMDANADLDVENGLNMTVLSYATMCYDEVKSSQVKKGFVLQNLNSPEFYFQKREEYLKKLLCINEKGQFATGLYKALQSKLDIQ